MTVRQAVDFTDGAMIALYPEPVQADELALDGYQPADDLHITLVYLGPDAAALDPGWRDTCLTILLAVAPTYNVLEGTVGGVGQFGPGDKGTPTIALPSVQGLNELRAQIVTDLAAAGIESPSEHGFVPHLTIGYDLPADGLDVIGQPLRFEAVSLSWGTDRDDVPFRGGIVEQNGWLTSRDLRTWLGPGR